MVRSSPLCRLGLVLALAAASLATPAIAQVQGRPSAQETDEAAPQSWLQRQVEWVRRLLTSPTEARLQGVAAKGPQAPAVTASRPAQRPVVEWDEYTGRLEPVEMVEVRARVAGYLKDVHFKDGQPVVEGDLLYTIDPRPFERILETARAELEQARIRTENASRDVERGRPLVEKRILSERVFEERENAWREGQAAVKVAEARVKAAELELSFTRIAAPIAGRMSRSNVTVGNYISAGGSNNATVLTTIVRQNPVHVYFDVGENNTLKYRRLLQAGRAAGAVVDGITVEVALPDESGFPHKGRLDFSDNRLDPGTGTLRARAVLDNGSGLFQPGMFARVRIAGSQSYPALLIPDEAIGTDQSNKFVYVVDDDGTARRRPIAPGPMVDGLRVVREGLSAADWVIVRGIQRARPGVKVVAKREPLQISSAPPKSDLSVEQWQ